MMPDTAAAAALAKARVLVVGDVMIDRFIHGTVERISPEAPVPVFKVERTQEMLGGAGNVLRNLSALGVECRLLTLGSVNGAIAPRVSNLVGQLPGAGMEVFGKSNYGTTVKERYIASGQQVMRVDRDFVPAFSMNVAHQALAAFTGALERFRPGAVLLSDYRKGTIGPHIAAALIARARSREIPVTVDSKAKDLSIFRGADLVTPNLHELAQASGLPVETDKEVGEACITVIQRIHIDNVLATRGARGMALANRGGLCFCPAAARTEIYDVSGAGDTVAAVMAAGMAVGIGPETAMRLANAAAGIVVGKAGTAAVRPEELLQALQTAKGAAPKNKIVTRAGMLEHADRWRGRGMRIGFANGVFDLLHPGHVAFLEQAKRACDRLAVGMNDDASAKRLKGTGRPAQDETARARVLASLSDVDLVVTFGEDTPLATIRALRPEVLIKGSEHPADLASDLILSGGGTIVVIDRTAGHSSSKTIGKIAKGAAIPAAAPGSGSCPSG